MEMQSKYDTLDYYDEYKEKYEVDGVRDKLYYQRLDFVIENGAEIEAKYSMNPEFVFDEYMYKVKPHLLLLTEFKIKENKVLEKEIAMGLDVSHRLFSVMKKYFPELVDVIKADKSLMAFKAQLALSEANRLKPDSAKTVDIMMRRYDPEYLKKEADAKPEHKLTVEFKNAVNPFSVENEEE